MSREPAVRVVRSEPRQAHELEFLCECGEAGCRERVRLALAEFERLRAQSAPILALRHLRREVAPVVLLFPPAR